MSDITETIRHDATELEMSLFETECMECPLVEGCRFFEADHDGYNLCKVLIPVVAHVNNRKRVDGV